MKFNPCIILYSTQ